MSSFMMSRSWLSIIAMNRIFLLVHRSIRVTVNFSLSFQFDDILASRRKNCFKKKDRSATSTTKVMIWIIIFSTFTATYSQYPVSRPCSTCWLLFVCAADARLTLASCVHLGLLHPCENAVSSMSVFALCSFFLVWSRRWSRRSARAFAAPCSVSSSPVRALRRWPQPLRTRKRLVKINLSW